MRITDEKIKLLKSTILSILPDAKVYLFGSRVDDNKKGGDIDILIIADRALNFIEEGKIKRQFFKHFGAQKLDLGNSQQITHPSCLSFCLSSALQLRLHSLLCALRCALKINKKSCAKWVGYLLRLTLVSFKESDKAPFKTVALMDAIQL